MSGGELDGELRDAADEDGEATGGEGLTGELPPDEPTGGGGPPYGGGGRRGGNLSEEGLTEPVAGTPVRGTVPFLSLDFDPIVYHLCIMDSKSNEHAREYVGLTRSEAVTHYLTRLAFEDFQRKLERREISGLANTLGDKLLKVMRVVALAARDEVHEAARADIISTLVQRGIATQERLEEVLGVAGSAVA
jgi:hypothetical protein